MSVLEAQACGLPAVVSDESGPQEIIADGQSGFVARVRERYDWGSALDELLEKFAASAAPARPERRPAAKA